MPNDIATRIGSTVSVAMDTKSEEFAYGAERFQEEARTLAKFIGNPNIAAVTSYFDENDTSYFVMDYIEGISFKTYIANHGGKISVEETLNVMIPVLRALTAVHAEGFIHRDVTPDNIYITKDGIVKLLDFGSARYSIGDKSKSLDVILKVGYAPKEQYIRRSRQGPFTDVYSCAACFYAAITGFLPPESLERMDEDTLVPISQCGIEIPEYLDKAILKGLAVQPEDRFQSAAEFLDAIESQQIVEVPASGGATTPAPEKKKVKPALIAGIAALVVAVAVGVGIAIGGRGGQAAVDADGEEIQLVEAEVPSITIRGVEYSTDLTELDLSGMGLNDADIEPLHYMVNLTGLNLAGNDLTDLSPLAPLTNLKSLRLGGFSETDTYGDNIHLSDLSPLSDLTNLERLYLSRQSAISDLSPLQNLTNLKKLEMAGQRYNYRGDGPITDLGPLAGLTKLESLDLDLGAVESLEPLSGLVNLQEIYFYAGSIGPDLRAFSQMADLRSLDLYTDGLESLEGLEPLSKLEFLRISGVNPFTDLSPLANLTSLTQLELTGAFSDITPLGNLTELRSLFLSPTEEGAYLTDLSPLANLKDVENLVLYVREVTDISPLAEMDSLHTLTIGEWNGPKIQDWSPVDHVPDVMKS